MRKTLLAAVFASLFAAGGALAASPPAQPAFAPEGPQTCLKCHNDTQQLPVLSSAHGVQGDPRTPFAQHGCESCHGPSPEHLASRTAAPNVLFNGRFASPPAVQNAMCLNCHQSSLRMNWQGSQHANNDVTCASCHTAHTHKDPVLLKVSQPQKCFTCHSEQRADSYKFSHHPIREGKVVCSDCHNPHGSPGPTLLKEVTINEVCYNCHAEKRGPLLWEHLPVRENCVNCHTPHGSNQPRLLIERPSFLCQDCHANSGHQSGIQSGAQLYNSGPGLPYKTFPPTGAAVTNYRAFARGCVNCHSQIHGSNNPSGAYFTR